MKTSPRIIAVSAAFALVLGACADDDADTALDDPPTEEEPIDEEPDEADEADEAEEAIEAEETDEAEETAEETDDATTDDGAATVAVDGTDLGNVLVDAEGMTLYMFDVDDQGGPSQCYDDCEQNWPPLVTDADPIAEAGADEALLATVERDDGSLQVTYDGWPLYYFVGDQAPGDVAGQAVNDVWWVLDETGEPQRDAMADDEGAGASY